MKREKLDDILKTKLQNYKSESNVPSWTEMHRRMVLAGNASGKPLPRSKRNVFLRYGLTAAVTLIILSLGVYYFNGPEDNFIKKLPIAVQNLSEIYNLPEEESTDFGFDSGLGDKFINDLLTSARKLVVLENIQAVSTEDIYNRGYNSDIITEDSEQTSEEVRNGLSSKNNSLSPSSINTYGGSRYASQAGSKSIGDFAKKSKTNKGWIAGIYINGAASSSSPNTPAREYSVFSESTPLVEMSYLNKSLDISGQELKHKYPVSVGLNVRKNLPQRFGIETGLIYTYLESTSELEGTFSSYKYNQRLHYLGVPLYVSYSMLNSDKWDLYVNGGGMAEVALSARGKTKIFNGDNFESETTTNLSAPGVVWSLGANVGLGYNLVDNFGIYIEPGVGYYFNNERHPQTYRTNNQLMFNLRAGFRVKF